MRSTPGHWRGEGPIVEPQRAAECEAAGMRISTFKSEALVLDQKRVACPLQVGGQILPQVEGFKYLEVLGSRLREWWSVSLRSLSHLLQDKIVDTSGGNEFPLDGGWMLPREVEKLSHSGGAWSRVAAPSHAEESAKGGDPKKDPETVSLGRPENTMKYLWKSWRKCLGRGKSGHHYLGCCLHNLKKTRENEPAPIIIIILILIIIIIYWGDLMNGRGAQKEVRCCLL
ncbi:hypothetical protein D4764_13G0004250 [Takifugu flavidus]|uniref:Uncharacterized protein n=1 Tax=Takifugu flavidus TaxID=433684 RepID=A0A5C6P8H5_9TELE|nr:hypothetical protein D4764_13G0004250 [Takifugu flavidus]